MSCPLASRKTNGVAKVIIVLIESPWSATCNNSRLGCIIKPWLKVDYALVLCCNPCHSSIVFPCVKIETVPNPILRQTNVSETWSPIPELSWNIRAVARTKTPPTFLYRCSIIETVSTIENPKAVKAARLNLVVKALLPQFSHHVICAKLVTSLSSIVVANDGLVIAKMRLTFIRIHWLCVSYASYFLCLCDTVCCGCKVYEENNVNI